MVSFCIFHSGSVLGSSNGFFKRFCNFVFPYDIDNLFWAITHCCNAIPRAVNVYDLPVIRNCICRCQIYVGQQGLSRFII